MRHSCSPPSVQPSAVASAVCTSDLPVLGHGQLAVWPYDAPDMVSVCRMGCTRIVLPPAQQRRRVLPSNKSASECREPEVQNALQSSAQLIVD